MPLHDTIQDFPAGACQTTTNIGRRNVVGGPVSPWTLKRERQDFGGQQWAMTIQLLPMEDEPARTIGAFLTSLRGTAGKFRHGDPYRSTPKGAASGKPVVVSATAGQQTLSINGLRPSTARQLAFDDYIEINGSLYAVLQDCASDANGAAEVTLWPDLRESYAAGTEIIWRNPRGTWSLVDNTLNLTREVIMRTTTTISCIEAT